MTTWDQNARPAASLLDALGATPLVRLARVAPDLELFAKIEWYGPTGSVKDRIYAHMLGKAEETGRLRPGMTIIECTTGNAGIACSAVAAIKGYECVIVMPEGMSPERNGVMVFAPDGTMIGHIALPERCANLCFGGVKRNRLFMAASHSLYSVYVNTQGAVGG